MHKPAMELSQKALTIVRHPPESAGPSQAAATSTRSADALEHYMGSSTKTMAWGLGFTVGYSEGAG